MPAFRRVNTTATDVRTELVVVGVTKGNVLTAPAREVDKALNGALKQHIKRTRSIGWTIRKQFDGDQRDVTVFPSMGSIGAKEVMVVGLGDAASLDADAVRRAAGTAARQSGGFTSVALDIGRDVEGGTQAAIEGFDLGAYAFTRYKTKKPHMTERVQVIGASQQDVDRALTYTGATAWARDLVNEYPSARGPAIFADAVAARAKTAGVKVEIFDEKALERKGMNGILTVGGGSASPPRFVVLTYDPKGSDGSVGLVGKGITFDSGGLSLKTAEGMETMKMDCTGAAAVAAAVTALGELDVKTKVVACIALAENMPGGRAAKPGDVIRHYGGRTSEVLNTDAEGRLVLADSLAWMSEQGPEAMVDVATLTGGMMVALGMKYAGFFANDDQLAAQIESASRRTGETVWRMPLVDEYRENLDTPVADIKNTAGTRYGAPIYGALFLKDFVGATPWAHIDIAGPAWAETGEHYLPIGATGFSTRLLIDWVANR